MNSEHVQTATSLKEHYKFNLRATVRELKYSFISREMIGIANLKAISISMTKYLIWPLPELVNNPIVVVAAQRDFELLI